MSTFVTTGSAFEQLSLLFFLGIYARVYMYIWYTCILTDTSVRVCVRARLLWGYFTEQFGKKSKKRYPNIWMQLNCINREAVVNEYVCLIAVLIWPVFLQIGVWNHAAVQKVSKRNHRFSISVSGQSKVFSFFLMSVSCLVLCVHTLHDAATLFVIKSWKLQSWIVNSRIVNNHGGFKEVFESVIIICYFQKTFFSPVNCLSSMWK